MKTTICGIGCSLIDYLYTDVSFSSEQFSRYLARSEGDGGLSPGKLVFAEELERFAGKDFAAIRAEISGGREPHSSNLGGPSIVALIHAAQLLSGRDVTVRFFGARGADHTGEVIRNIVARTPIETSGYRVTSGRSPFTVVFSDPTYDNGHGERTFVNNIGAAGNFSADQVAEDFFSGDIVEFGGTALVPGIHDGLELLLQKAKAKGALTVVNTVYDFRSEKANPESRWPLGGSDRVFPLIDLFIADLEEALRTTGTSTAEDAMQFLREMGVGSVVITEGARPVHLVARQREFARLAPDRLPVSERVTAELRAGRLDGDTTGCGDNFVGGILASMVAQLQQGMRGKLDLRRACALGVVSGGHACRYVGGTYLETVPGEKRRLVAPLYSDYIAQIGAPGHFAETGLFTDADTAEHR
ncbi:carbohydrate kinase family protein [Salinispira pacifica]